MKHAQKRSKCDLDPRMQHKLFYDFRTCACLQNWGPGTNLKLLNHPTMSLVLVITWIDLPPIVENWPNESSEATLIPFSRVVTCVTWSCLFCHDSVPPIIDAGGISCRGWLSGGWFSGEIPPLLRHRFLGPCLDVLWKARSDLHPRNMGTPFLAAIFFSYRGLSLFSKCLSSLVSLWCMGTHNVPYSPAISACVTPWLTLELKLFLCRCYCFLCIRLGRLANQYFLRIFLIKILRIRFFSLLSFKIFGRFNF